jgi:hypothetical protein
MSLIIAAALIIIGLVGAVIVAVSVPLLVGMMAYDVKEARKVAPVDVRDTSLSIAVKRGIARAFVLSGGLFWAVAAFAALYSYRQTGVGNALMAALIPLVAVAATLIVGWYFERVTAAMLLMASVAVVAYGVIFQFELGVWMIMTFVLIGPMATAAALFWAARQEQDAFELATSLRPELALVFAARSTIAPKATA